MSTTTGPSPIPVFVDLDGTLVHTDLLVESALRFVLRHPFRSPILLLWLLAGKAHLKSELARRVELDAATLPYNAPLLAHLTELAGRGVPIYLATGANIRYASAVAAHLGIFESVLASDAGNSLSGANKLRAIRQASPQRFIYAGNHPVDLPIWAASAGALVVGAPASVERKVRAHGIPILGSFSRPGALPWALLRALRPHQWLKNLLVFLPLLPIAGSVELLPALMQTILAFIAFSLCASAVYVINDLSDLNADRSHPRKCMRPFAAGQVPLQLGIVGAPALLLASALIAFGVGVLFAGVLAVYFVLTLAYTFTLKRFALVDVLVLAILYTLRVLSGAAAIQVPPSFWILAFSLFLFFSLALAKRYVELHTFRGADKPGANGRGYVTGDMPALQTMGIASGYLAVMVVALYINSPDVTGRYGHVSVLWGLGPLLMLWVSRVWLKAIRCEMHDDPLVFALKDRVSLVATAVGVALLLAALWG
jgi:4-hydroxybenzoate polyprenyltransferase/beta-phosphoglucomutase-like phosphatase (HAD superfamily)